MRLCSGQLFLGRTRLHFPGDWYATQKFAPNAFPAPTADVDDGISPNRRTMPQSRLAWEGLEIT